MWPWPVTHLNYHMKSSKVGSNFSLLSWMQLLSWCMEPQIVLDWKHTWRRFYKGHPAMDTPCSSFVSFGPTPSLDLHPSARDNECLGPLNSTSRLSLTTTGALFHAVRAVYTKIEAAPLTLPLPVLSSRAFWGKLGLMGASGIFFSIRFLVELPSSGSCAQSCRWNPVSTRNFVGLWLTVKIKESIIGRLTVIAKGWDITASPYLRLNPYFSKLMKIKLPCSLADNPPLLWGLVKCWIKVHSTEVFWAWLVPSRLQQTKLVNNNHSDLWLFFKNWMFRKAKKIGILRFMYTVSRKKKLHMENST